MKKYDKYKESGIEWIDGIPELWSVLSLKYCVQDRIRDGSHETPTFIKDGVPFVSAEAVQDGKINFDSVRGYISIEENERYSQKYKPQKHDIFIVKSGSTTGKIGYVKMISRLFRINTKPCKVFSGRDSCAFLPPA